MNSLLSVLIINMVVCRYHRSICKLRSIERRSICTRTLYQFICIYIFRGLIKCENLHSRLYLIAFSLRFFFLFVKTHHTENQPNLMREKKRDRNPCEWWRWKEAEKKQNWKEIIIINVNELTILNSRYAHYHTVVANVLVV